MNIVFSFLTKHRLVFLFGVLASPVFSQSDSTHTLLNDSNAPSALVEAKLSMNYGSTNLNNEFIQILLFGGKIEERLKDKILDKTNKRNRFGVEVNYEARYYDLKDTLFKKLPDYNYYIGFGSYNNLSASYTHDLFSTVFYGNKQFENQTAQLGRSNFTSYKFEKITVGLIRRDWKNSFGISLIIGDRYNGYNFKQADMFTHPDGTDITMNYEGKVRLSDNKNPGNFMGFSGSGLGLDYSTLLANRKYTFSVTNFGFAVWARNPSYSNTKTEYNFDGIEVDNIFNVTSEELETKAKNILPQLEDRAFITMLPTIVRFDKNFNEELTLQSIYGIRYKFFSNYLPSAYGGVSYTFSPKFRMVGSLAWGGYAGLRGGVGAYYSHKKFYAGLESSNITGIFMKNGNGNGINVFASYYF